jgi:hypothetical protein
MAREAAEAEERARKKAREKKSLLGKFLTVASPWGAAIDLATGGKHLKAIGEDIGNVAGEVTGANAARRAKNARENALDDQEGTLGDMEDIYASNDDDPNDSFGQNYFRNVEGPRLASLYDGLDPRSDAAQDQAIDRLGQISRGGYTAEESAAMAGIRAEEGARERSGRAAVQERMRARGMSRSGLSAAMDAENQQQRAQREALRGAETEKNMFQRGLAATTQMGAMGAQRQQNLQSQRQSLAEQRAQAQQTEYNTKINRMARDQETRQYMAQQRQGILQGLMNLQGQRGGVKADYEMAKYAGAKGLVDSGISLGKTVADAGAG